MEGVLVGFSVWPVLLVLGIIVMIIAGMFQYNMVNGRVHRRYNERFLQIIAAVLSAVVEFTMIVEMGQGLTLRIESFLVAFMGFAIVGMLMIVTFWGVGEMVGKIVRGKLRACLR
jgi:hypothetical protein